MAETNIIQLIKNFSFEDLLPVNLVYGKEELLKRQLIDKVKSFKGEDIHILWGDETSVKEIEEIFSSSSLFSKGNIAVLWDLESFIKNLKKGDTERFLDTLRKINSPDRFFIISNKDKLPAKEPYKSLKEIANIIVSAPLTPKAFVLSIKKKIEGNGKKIDDRTVLYLSSKLKNDLMYAKQEIEKLLLYVSDKDEITEEDIDKVVIPKIEENIFVFLNRFFSKDPKAVEIFINLIETTHHPFEVQSFLLGQLNKLLVFRSLLDEGKPLDAVFSQLGIKHPAQKGTFQKLVSVLSKEDLIEMIKELYKLEIQQKVYYSDIYESSTEYVIKMVNG
ncbi:MAG TPA: DNA polymerase III subunit delta [Persephonella sp.]|uniref:DNA-directed DNA polymerase n=1 Tax=Persephonella marina (strain DSM 14350 / EX-H1) TaxID=123214 RepID=C0QS77_PERMH|nr:MULTISPECIES: DNA polymerase III subunit delta [Persephonella]ACO03392.1 DNA polymerase III, delta subunit [Persephonella marina EX-H1]HCB69266.1 DNA polymerase III subunit delta [Persephonella sp.]